MPCKNITYRAPTKIASTKWMGSVLRRPPLKSNYISHMNQLHQAQSNSSKAWKQNPPTLSATSPAILSSGWGWVWVGCCSPATIVAPPRRQRHGGLFERRVAQGYPIWCFGNSCIGSLDCVGVGMNIRRHIHRYLCDCLLWARGCVLHIHVMSTTSVASIQHL